MSDTTLLLLIAVVVVGGTMIPFILRERRREREGHAAEAEAKRLGLDEPVTLHPVVDLDRCIGTGACVEVCPEGTVLVLRDGQAHPIAPACCIGHGLCERSCPVDAITLVFGTATRGVEIPRVKQNFETNVPGLYIVGELAGMGLIRNAFEQGRQCVEGIVKEGGPRASGGMLDVTIVGCGPAGLAASLYALEQGLSVKTLEREDIGGTVRHYPRKKLVMTAPVPVPGFGKIAGPEIQKEDLMGLWENIIHKTGLTVNTQESADQIKPRAGGGFDVITPKGTYATRKVILAIGRRGKPRRLGVPGEQLPKVAYALHEPEAYQNDRVVVVGGGDSAVEAALALAGQPGNRVTMSYRRDKFSRLKPANRERIDRAIAAGQVHALWNSNLVEITPELVRYKDEAAGVQRETPNDYVFVFAGGELPTEFLKACGVAIDTKFGTA